MVAHGARSSAPVTYPSQPSGHAGPDPSSAEARPVGVERAALADQARALASRVLAALQACGYPGMQLVMLTAHSPFIALRKQWQVAAWEIGRLPVPGKGKAAGEAVCWLLADGEFAVSTRQAALEKREAEDLPDLPAVIRMLRTLAG